jgi:putative oxidoreductase
LQSLPTRKGGQNNRKRWKDVAIPHATIALIQSSTLPLPPPLAYVGAIAVEVGCGLLIILGYQTRIVAAVFALFCLATAVFFHVHFADPNQTFHFIKNIIMTGGLLQIVANGAGAFSIDNWREKQGGTSW